MQIPTKILRNLSLKSISRFLSPSQIRLLFIWAVIVSGYIYKYISQKLRRLNSGKSTNQRWFDGYLNVALAKTAEELDHALDKHKFRLSKILGLDCEWKPSFLNSDKKRGKIALLQLCNSEVALLIQVQQTGITKSLSQIMNDPTIIKVGVGIKQDVSFLLRDYNLQTNGAVELNDFYPGTTNNLKSLQKLAEQTLSISLSKDKSVQLSNWEVKNLSQNQLNYAAEDVIASRAIFVSLHQGILFETNQKTILNYKSSNQLTSSKTQTPKLKTKRKKSADPKELAINDAKRAYNEEQKKIRVKKKSRKTNLYDNCALLAPDGELISLVPESKMNWYLRKQLAKPVANTMDKVSASIMLNFEPRGRNMVQDEFYLQKKDNICVVCGKNEHLNKFYIVPYEFRKHFPFRFRVRSSHDVVLICVNCRYIVSPMYVMRRKRWLLAAFGDAFDEREYSNGQYTIFHEIKHIKKLASALLRASHQIPDFRKLEIERKIMVVLEAENIPHDKQSLDEDFLNNILTLDERVQHEDFVSAPAVVVSRLISGDLDAIDLLGLPCKNDGCACNHCKGDITEDEDLEHDRLKPFIRSWRDLFQKSAKPRFLSKGWKVDHRIQDYIHGMDLSKAADE